MLFRYAIEGFWGWWGEGLRNGRREGFKGWECVGFMTTNKPPGRRNTMILGILNMHLCLCFFITTRAYDLLQSWHSAGKRDLWRSKETYEKAKRPRAYDLLQSSHSTGCFILHLFHGYIPFYLTIDIICDISVISISQLQTKGMGEGVVSLIY